MKLICFHAAQRKNEVVYAGFDVATNTPLAGKKMHACSGHDLHKIV